LTTTTSGSYGASTDRTDNRRTVRSFTESKLGFKTSEFYVMVIFAVASIVAAYASKNDSFGREDGWRFASFVAVAYIVSRGLAKLGIREPFDRDA
jgi:hypothetical protein